MVSNIRFNLLKWIYLSLMFKFNHNNNSLLILIKIKKFQTHIYQMWQETMITL